MDATLAEIIANGVTEAELERARTGLLADAIYARDSLFTGARIFGNALTAGATVDDVESWPDRVRAVTSEDVVEAARAVFRMERSVTAILSPEEKS